MAALDGWRDWRDAAVEATFHAIYGSPVVQALLGLRASDAPPRARPGREPEQIAFVQQEIADLKARIGQGGMREAFVRAMIYVRLPELAADERSFAVLQKVREEHAADLGLADFKALVRDQFLMLQLDEARAVATLPQLLEAQPRWRRRRRRCSRRVVTAAGPLGAEAAARLARVAVLFGAPASGQGNPRRRLSVAGGRGCRRLTRRHGSGGERPAAAAELLRLGDGRHARSGGRNICTWPRRPSPA